MAELDVSVSVGATSTDQQEAFVRAIEERLRSEGIVPHTVGRNTFRSDAPLKAITELMDRCCGTVVIALERNYFATGIDKRGGPKEASLADIRLPTPWNQIEAAMAYSRSHPLLVIVESGLRSEGLLERGNDWFVQWVKPDAAALTTPEFNGILANWKEKIAQPAKRHSQTKSMSDLSVAELLGSLKPAQLRAFLTAMAVLIGGAFALGGKLLVH
jgi:hypothetical protein